MSTPARLCTAPPRDSCRVAALPSVRTNGRLLLDTRLVAEGARHRVLARLLLRGLDGVGVQARGVGLVAHVLREAAGLGRPVVTQRIEERGERHGVITSVVVAG